MPDQELLQEESKTITPDSTGGDIFSRAESSLGRKLTQDEVFRLLYDRASEHYNLPDEGLFNKALLNDELRKKVYIRLAPYIDLPDYSTFENIIVGQKDESSDIVETLFGTAFKARTPEQLEAIKFAREKLTSGFAGKAMSPEERVLYQKAIEMAQEGSRLGLVGEAFVGLMQGATTGLVGDQERTEKGFLGLLAREGGKLAGFVVGPLTLAKAAVASVDAVVPRVVSSKVREAVTRRLGAKGIEYLREGATLGIATMASDNRDVVELISDPSFDRVVDVIENKSLSFLSGAVTGARFAAIRDAVPTFALRAALNIAITNATLLATGVARGEIPSTEDMVFAALMDAYFSVHGKVPERSIRDAFRSYAKDVSDRAGLRNLVDRVRNIRSGSKNIEEAVSKLKNDISSGDLVDNLKSVGLEEPSPAETKAEPKPKKKTRAGKVKKKSKEEELVDIEESLKERKAKAEKKPETSTEEKPTEAEPAPKIEKKSLEGKPPHELVDDYIKETTKLLNEFSNVRSKSGKPSALERERSELTKALGRFRYLKRSLKKAWQESNVEKIDELRENYRPMFNIAEQYKKQISNFISKNKKLEARRPAKKSKKEEELVDIPIKEQPKEVVERDIDLEKPRNDAVVAIKTKDGKIYRSKYAKNHSELADKRGLDPDNIDDTGWIINGKFVGYRDKVEKPTEQKKEPIKSTASEKKVAKPKSEKIPVGKTVEYKSGNIVLKGKVVSNPRDPKTGKVNYLIELESGKRKIVPEDKVSPADVAIKEPSSAKESSKSDVVREVSSGYVVTYESPKDGKLYKGRVEKVQRFIRSGDERAFFEVKRYAGTKSNVLTDVSEEISAEDVRAYKAPYGKVEREVTKKETGGASKESAKRTTKTTRGKKVSKESKLVEIPALKEKSVSAKSEEGEQELTEAERRLKIRKELEERGKIKKPAETPVPKEGDVPIKKSGRGFEESDVINKYATLPNGVVGQVKRVIGDEPGNRVYQIEFDDGNVKEVLEKDILFIRSKGKPTKSEPDELISEEESGLVDIGAIDPASEEGLVDIELEILKREKVKKSEPVKTRFKTKKEKILSEDFTKKGKPKLPATNTGIYDEYKRVSKVQAELHNIVHSSSGAEKNKAIKQMQDLFQYKSRLIYKLEKRLGTELVDVGGKLYDKSTIGAGKEPKEASEVIKDVRKRKLEEKAKKSSEEPTVEISELSAERTKQLEEIDPGVTEREPQVDEYYDQATGLVRKNYKVGQKLSHPTMGEIEVIEVRKGIVTVRLKSGKTLKVDRLQLDAMDLIYKAAKDYGKAHGKDCD